MPVEEQCHCVEHGMSHLVTQASRRVSSTAGWASAHSRQVNHGKRSFPAARSSQHKGTQYNTGDESVCNHSAWEVQMQGGKFSPASCKLFLTIYPCGQRGWRIPENQKLSKSEAWTEERDCWRGDKVRENIADQMQPWKKLKGKDKEQTALIVPYSPLMHHHPLGRHGQPHIHQKHMQNIQLIKIPPVPGRNSAVSWESLP